MPSWQVMYRVSLSSLMRPTLDINLLLKETRSMFPKVNARGRYKHDVLQLSVGGQMTLGMTLCFLHLKFLGMSGKRKKVTVTMEKKLEALFRIDKGEPMKSVATALGVGTSTVSDWKKNRKEIEDFCAKMVSRDSLGNRGTIKKAKNVTLDEALYVWYIQERENGVLISGPMLRKKALSLNNKLGSDPTFTASVGWLGRWKARHGIRLTLSGENLLGDSTPNDNADHQLLLEDDIVTVCLSTQDEEEIQDEEETQNCLEDRCRKELTSLNHAEAAEMLQKLITYFEQQSETLENELITLKHLRDRASKKCLLTLKQEKTSDFVK